MSILHFIFLSSMSCFFWKYHGIFWMLTLGLAQFDVMFLVRLMIFPLPSPSSPTPTLLNFKKKTQLTPHSRPSPLPKINFFRKLFRDHQKRFPWVSETVFERPIETVSETHENYIRFFFLFLRVYERFHRSRMWGEIEGVGKS